MTNTEQRLIQWLQQQLQAEQILWQTFPDPTKRAKQPLTSSLTSSWIFLVVFLEQDQFVQKSYYPQELSQLDFIERFDGWGDIVNRHGGSLTGVSSSLCGVGHVWEVVTLLQRLQTEQRVTAPPMKA